ncbi:MAG TPA: ferritin family protein [Sedimentisphaerales bacterium]|nr:ferritin family protein [Sedimentisphaerales bacterium]
MSITFNADEVFEMAEEIERNGARFYREAASKAADRGIKEMFLGMASMEDGHLRTFQEMRKSLTEREKGETAFDPYNEATLYLQALADSKGFEGMKSPTQKLTGRESVRELLETAIGAEQNSVLYYVGLKDRSPPRQAETRLKPSSGKRFDISPICDVA